MKLDRAGMRMWEGLREREARSNPGGYEKILKKHKIFCSNCARILNGIC